MTNFVAVGFYLRNRSLTLGLCSTNILLIKASFFPLKCSVFPQKSVKCLANAHYKISLFNTNNSSDYVKSDAIADRQCSGTLVPKQTRLDTTALLSETSPQSPLGCITVNPQISAALRISAAPRIGVTPRPTNLISAALE